MNQESTHLLIQGTDSRLRSAWIDLIKNYLWHHYVTLSFKDPVSREVALYHFSKFIRRLERKGNGIWWCHVIEKGRIGGMNHFHCLLGGTDLLTVDEIEYAWRSGFADVSLFDPQRGAVVYITKEIESGRSEVDFSRHIERTIRRWERKRSLVADQKQPDSESPDPSHDAQDHQPTFPFPGYTPPPFLSLPPSPKPNLLIEPARQPLLLPAGVEAKDPEIKRWKKWWLRIKDWGCWLRSSLSRMRTFWSQRSRWKRTLRNDDVMDPDVLRPDVPGRTR